MYRGGKTRKVGTSTKRACLLTPLNGAGLLLERKTELTDWGLHRARRWSWTEAAIGEERGGGLGSPGDVEPSELSAALFARGDIHLEDVPEEPGPRFARDLRFFFVLALVEESQL